MSLPKNMLITGMPKVGKTTLIKELTMPYIARVGGFYTEEFCRGGVRQGFKIKTFNGEEGVLAQKGMKTKYKVSKYNVDIKALDNIGVKSMEDALAGKEMIVIDEIGSMEIISDEFRKVLFRCLESDKYVLASVRYKSHPFTDEIKKVEDKEVFLLSKNNYFETKDKIKEWMHNIFK